MIGRGQWVAVVPIAKRDLALEVGAPEVIRTSAFRERRAARAVARPTAAPDQAVAIEHRVDGAFGRNPDIAVEPPDQQLANLARTPMRLLGLPAETQGRDAGPPDQQLANLARTPMRLLGLQADNQGLDLGRQLIGVADRPPGAVAQRFEAMLLVAVENLVAGLAGDPEIPADLGHC